MTAPIIEFQRPFQIWQYTVSHGQLLLRSVQGIARPTQVDVLFKAVAGMNLPTSFQGLQIHHGELEQATAMGISTGAYDPKHSRFYKLSGDGWSGGILAGVVAWVDDSSDYHEPSKLMSGYWKGPSA